MTRVLFPLPATDFDTTEVAVPWRVLTRAGHDVVFSTEHGDIPACDPLLLTGVLFGQLGAAPDAIACYEEMIHTPAFLHPIPWRDIEPTDFDAIWLAGGHAPGMRPYLESVELQEKVVAFFLLDRPVAAICHGPLIAARAGLLHGRRTACLPRYLERTAWMLTAWKLGRYYRTYDTWVEDELIAAGAQIDNGPTTFGARGTDDNDGPAYAVEDGNWLTARWPGDSWLLARKLLARLRPAGETAR